MQGTRRDRISGEDTGSRQSLVENNAFKTMFFFASVFHIRNGHLN